MYMKMCVGESVCGRPSINPARGERIILRFVDRFRMLPVGRDDARTSSRYYV